jgi:phosphohistidine phosphatase SixA
VKAAFLRHGEPRGSDSDPELTSEGRRMAAEAGAWLTAQLFVPGLVLVTPTTRTRQTADEALAGLPPIARKEVASLPEDAEAWIGLMERTRRDVGPDGAVLLVGHHPTQEFLARAFGPTLVPIPRNHRAAAMVLAYEGASSWTVRAMWPGRPIG